jgi:hypothetical protein
MIMAFAKARVAQQQMASGKMTEDQVRAGFGFPKKKQPIQVGTSGQNSRASAAQRRSMLGR